VATEFFRGPLSLAQSPTFTVLTGSASLGGSTSIPARAYVMRAPATYTREDMVELHLPASAPILQRLMSGMIERGARAAQPGEFTERAFLNGRIDLTQAEAVLRAIHAMHAGELRNAINQLRGFAHKEIDSLRNRILELMSLLELNIDFSDQNIELVAQSDVRARLRHIRDETQAILKRASRLAPAEGVPVVLCGPPNAGKSTLFNALVGSDKAIVSHVPGTTRDFIEAQTEIEGIPIRLIDTAGLGETRDVVERLAQEQSRDKAAAAAVLVYVVDIRDATGRVPALEIQPDIVALNKTDTADEEAVERFRRCSQFFPVLPVCALWKDGLETLKEAIVQAARPAAVGHAFVPNLRQSNCLRRAIEGIDAALCAGGDEIIAYELKCVTDALGDVIGQIPTDEVLDRVFAHFCIGK
jgi:tRNA modification GTPase